MREERGPVGAWIMGLTPAVLVSCVVTAAGAHSGGLDSKGCHTNRKTSEYHCHRASADTEASDTPQQAVQPKVDSIDRTGARAGPFRNCTEARAVGAAPIARGEPGYAPHLDRDNDGIACEPWGGR